MMKCKTYRALEFGDSQLGYLSPVELQDFDAKRFYWISKMPDKTKRGGHAHKICDQLFVCLRGYVNFYIEEAPGKKDVFMMDPRTILYVPRMVWHSMTFGYDSILVALASQHHDENDYIRGYDEWTSAVSAGA